MLGLIREKQTSMLQNCFLISISTAVEALEQFELY